MQEPVATIVNDYWAAHLGCSVVDLSRLTPLVISHSDELADYRGISILYCDGAPVISVPADCRERFTAWLDTLSPDDVISPVRFTTQLANLWGTVIGPAFIGYADESTLQRFPGASRILGPIDEPAVRDLEASCAAIEWEHGGSSVLEQPATGVFVGDRLVALAGYEVWGDAIAHISIITHSAFRGQGLARQAVAGIAEHALAAGLVPQYRTLLANAPSIRVAELLGFRQHATSIAIRLSDDCPPVRRASSHPSDKHVET